VTYWTWSGHKGDQPTLHVFSYGLFNLWEDGLTVESHWLEADPPKLRPEVLKDLRDWNGEWNANALEIRFPHGNDQGALMWKLKYTSKSGCTSPDVKKPDPDGVYRVKGTGLGKKI